MKGSPAKVSPLQYKLLKPVDGMSLRQFNEVLVNKQMIEMRNAIMELQELYIASLTLSEHTG